MIQVIIPVLVFAAVSTATPGIATTLATASGARFGVFRSLPVIAGSAAGLATVTAAAGAGLAGLLLAAPSLQLAMKTAGSLYLVWLAWKIGNGGRPDLDSTMAAPVTFLGGAGIQLLNPKGWAMGLGAAASFTALASGPTQLAILLGAVFGLTAAASLSCWCLAGALLARTLRTDRQWRVLNAALGTILAASIIPMWLHAGA